MDLGCFRIRHGEARDVDAAYEVCLRTGEGGQDATDLYQDPQALGHLFVGPYLRLEPSLAFVLEDNQGVCGYVLGALDSRRFHERYRDEWLPLMRQRYPEPTGDPAGWTRTQQCYAEYYHPKCFWPEPYEQYPSHLHIDLLPRAQGCGQGREMMAMILTELAAQGSPGVQLGMWVSNHRAEHFYRKLGFHELARVGPTLYLGKRLP